VAIRASGMLWAKLIRNATLKIYAGARHGLAQPFGTRSTKTHSVVQVLLFDEGLMLRRHYDSMNVAGGSGAVQLSSGCEPPVARFPADQIAARRWRC